MAYALGGKFYLQPTGKVSGFAWPLMRGPAFAIDEETSGLARLPADGRKDPSPMEMCEAVERYYNEGVNIVGMGENDTGAAFAGYGEPLLRLQAVTEAATLIRERRHGVPLRVVTTGLGDVGDVSDVASQLAGAGISAATVNLLAATPDAFERRVSALSETYRELLGDDAKDALPVRAGAFGAVCTLVEALSEKGTSGALVDWAKRNLNRNVVRVGGTILALLIGTTHGLQRPDVALETLPEDVQQELAAMDPRAAFLEAGSWLVRGAR